MNNDDDNYSICLVLILRSGLSRCLVNILHKWMTVRKDWGVQQETKKAEASQKVCLPPVALTEGE